MPTPTDQTERTTFTMFEPAPTSKAIKRATAHGARFEQCSDGWKAIARKRGRTLPMVTFLAPTQYEAAADYLRYFHVRGS